MTSGDRWRTVPDIATIDVRSLLTAPDVPEMAHITTAEIDALSQELLERDGGGTMFFSAGDYCIQHLAEPDPAQRTGTPPPGVVDHCRQGGVRLRPKVSFVGEGGTRLVWCDGIPVYKLDPDDPEEEPAHHPVAASFMSGAAPFVWNPASGGSFVQAVIVNPSGLPADDVRAGDLTFRVDTLTGFADDDPVVIRLDDVDDDSANVRWWAFANVDHVTAGSPATITLDRPAQIPCVVGAQTDLRSHVIMKVDPAARLDGIEVANFELVVHEDATPPQGGIVLSYARNCRISNVVATDVGAGAVQVRYAQNTQARNVFVKSATIPADPDDDCSTDPSIYGRGVTLHAVQGARVADLRVEHFETDPVVVEQHSVQAQFENVYLMNNHADRAQSTYGMVTSTEASDLSVDGLTVEGLSGFRLVRTDEGARRLSITDLTVRPVVGGIADGSTAELRGGVRHDRVIAGSSGADRYVYYYDTPRVWAKAVQLPVGATTAVNLLRLPDGLIRRGRVFSSVDDADGLTELKIVNTGPSSFVAADLAGDVLAGTTIDLPASVTTIGPATVAEQQVLGTPSYEPEARYLSVKTTASLPTGAYVVIQLEYFPYRSPTAGDTRDDHDGGYVQGIDTLRSESVLVGSSYSVVLADHDDWSGVRFTIGTGSPEYWQTSVAAKPGDVLQFAPNFTVGGTDATDVSFNVKCAGTLGSLWSTGGLYGYAGWRARSSSAGTARPVTGGVTYRVKDDDIVDGQVTARVMFRLTDDTKEREIVVTNNQAARIELINMGCP